MVIRTILTVSILLFFKVGMALAATDYRCLGDCTAKGYLYNYCRQACSYQTQQPSLLPPVFPRGTDYRCMSDCTAKGYLYNYCKQACSY